MSRKELIKALKDIEELNALLEEELDGKRHARAYEAG